jgi:hypothetical protein
MGLAYAAISFVWIGRGRPIDIEALAQALFLRQDRETNRVIFLCHKDAAADLFQCQRIIMQVHFANTSADFGCYYGGPSLSHNGDGRAVEPCYVSGYSGADCPLTRETLR